MLVPIHQIAWCHIAEDWCLNIEFRESLKLRMAASLLWMPVAKWICGCGLAILWWFFLRPVE
jgi:hypothetical protein